MRYEYFVVLFLLSLVTLLEAITRNYFRLFYSGKAFENYVGIYRQKSYFQCAMVCDVQDSCTFFSHFKKDKHCRIHSLKLYEKKHTYRTDSRWDIYIKHYPIIDKKWGTLVFNAMAKSGIDVRMAFQDGSYQKYLYKIPGLYRSPDIDSWSKFKITKVNVVVHRYGRPAVELCFSIPTYIGKTGWFQPNYMISSPWTDVSNTYKFSMRGDDERTFMIWKSYGTDWCSDYAWFVVKSGRDRHKCVFDHSQNFPVFRYSGYSTVSQFKTQGWYDGEVFSIFVK